MFRVPMTGQFGISSRVLERYAWLIPVIWVTACSIDRFHG